MTAAAEVDEVRVVLPVLHRSQREVAQHPARFKVLAAGRRWRKTSLGVQKATETALQGGRAWWVAPTFPLASIGWRFLKFVARQLPDARIHEDDRRITFAWSGGEVQVKSADNPDSLRGVGLDGVVIDEAAYIKQEAWTAALRPALSDRQGWALFISTPNGFNWFHRLWEMATALPGWARWQFPSWDNPHLDPGEIEQARGELGDFYFRQEYGAEFLELAGLKPFLRDAIQYWGPGGAVEELPEDLEIQAGFDPAISKKDTAARSAMVIAGQSRRGETRGQIFTLDAIAGHWSVYEQVDHICKAFLRWRFRRIRIEKVAYQAALAEVLDREARLRGLPIHVELVPPEVDKLRRAMGWSGLVEGGVVLIGPGQQNLVTAMLAVPQDPAQWDLVDAGGLCVGGFTKYGGASDPLPGDEAHERATSYAVPTRTRPAPGRPRDPRPLPRRSPSPQRARGYAARRPTTLQGQRGSLDALRPALPTARRARV